MQIPFFDPLHPAVRISCNFCGTLIQTDRYLTERVRNVQTLEKQGDYVFCEPCGERAAELIGKVNDFRASLASKLNDEIEKSAMEYAASLVPSAFPVKHQEQGETPSTGAKKSTKDRQPTSAKRRALPGEIPQPKPLNG